MDNWLFFIILAFIAEILGTIGGFGSSLFFVPIASYFMDFKMVLGITALFHVFSNASKIYFFHKGIDRKLCVWLGIPAVIFVVIGALLSNYINTNILEIILSVFLIIISLFFLFYNKNKLKATQTNAFTGGIFSGFIAGLAGTGGAIRGLVLSAFQLPKETFIATSALIDFFVDFSRMLIYFKQDYIQVKHLYLVPILIIVSFFGTYIGKIALNYVSEDQFKKVVLVLIFITGIFTLVKYC